MARRWFGGGRVAGSLHGFVGVRFLYLSFVSVVAIAADIASVADIAIGAVGDMSLSLSTSLMSLLGCLLFT